MPKKKLKRNKIKRKEHNENVKEKGTHLSTKHILLGLGAAIIIGFFVLNSFGPKQDYSALADCLTEKGIIMAGTDSCPACRSQKEKFGEAFEKILYKNCDTELNWCAENGIYSVPTWVFPDGMQTVGVKDYSFLSRAAGCETDN